MIAYLSGTILEINARTLVLDVQGVGYLVYASRSFLEKIKVGQSQNLHIHMNVREDEISLYGFAAQEELAFFKLLLTVSGVGPKSALEIMNAPLKKVKQSIAQKDSVWLTSIPGIGTKTAERICVDLHGKVKIDIAEESLPRGGREDIVQALVSLGYHRQQVVQGLRKIPTEIEGEEAIIKYFLQNV